MTGSIRLSDLQVPPARVAPELMMLSWRPVYPITDPQSQLLPTPAKSGQKAVPSQISSLTGMALLLLLLP